MSALPQDRAPASAAREAAADASDTPRQYLRLAVAGEVHAVAIDVVREILETTRLTPVPQTPDFVRGVMNLRGAVVPVIDLAARVGRAPAVIGKRSCIVIVDVVATEDGSHHTVGMLVDAVYEVFDIGAEGLEPAPSLGTSIGLEHLRGMARLRGQFLAVLDLDRLLSPHSLAELIGTPALH